MTVPAGLNSAVAEARLLADGPNELPRAKPRSPLRVGIEVLREPMLALLLGAGIAYLALGDIAEALVLLAFATFSVAVTVTQEVQTERVLQALGDLSAPQALVIRDGTRRSIARHAVVRGDLLVLEQGDRIAADVSLIEAHDLQVDESLLTGEALPVGKTAQGASPAERGRPGGEDQPFAYAGTLVTRGSGLGEVFATGPHSEIGRIGQSLAALDSEAPRLRAQTKRIVAWCAAGGVSVALLVVLLYGLLRGGWIEAVLAGIAIGMAMLPEEFPVVLTVFLAMGAWRIGKVEVLTRRAAAIETLGSATVLCTDKTGTLTENRMTVAELWLPSGDTSRVYDYSAVPPQFHALLEIAALASAADPADPMEQALHSARAGAGAAANTRTGGTLAHSYSLRPELLAMSNVWDEGDALTVTAKGAPEAIAKLCRLSRGDRRRMMSAVEAMAARGVRVLGVASAVPPDRNWPATQHGYHYRLLGLVGLADPLRESVPAAVAECRAAGIRVVMITGDHAATARSIAADAGIEAGDILTGAELDRLSDAELAARLKTVTVFARIMPEQKLRIVEAFKSDGEIVAMTGDGVNDAPSLKAANIGVAMGRRGTDVAREASAIVLLGDDFGSIVHAVRLGRRIYDNIRKAMAFIFAAHVPIAGLAVLPLMLGLPILFGPIHIALLEMLIDPVCALVFEAEPEETDIMERPPRDPDESLFSFSMVAWSVLQVAVALALLVATYAVQGLAGMPEGALRALMFFALVFEIMALILVNRSFDTSLAEAVLRHNRALLLVALGVLAIVGAISAWPAASETLEFGPVSWGPLALAASLAGILLLILEACKRIAKRIIRPAPQRALR